MNRFLLLTTAFMVVVAYVIVSAEPAASGPQKPVASFDITDLGWPEDATSVSLVDITDGGSVLLNVTYPSGDAVLLIEDGEYGEIDSFGIDITATGVALNGDISVWTMERGDGVVDPLATAALISGDSLVEMPGEMNQSKALGIGPEGMVVGQAATEGEPQLLRPAYWSDTEVVFLAGTEDTEGGGALDVNSLGQVVGWLGDTVNATMPVLWDDDSIVVLDESDAPFGAAVAINATGFIVGGVSDRSDFRGPGTQARSWGADAALTPASADEFSWTFANDVNDAGIVVGLAGDAGGSIDELDTVAVIWSAGELFDLNQMTSAPEGLLLVEAVSLNNFGQILCLAIDGAGNSHIVVLSVIGN